MYMANLLQMHALDGMSLRSCCILLLRCADKGVYVYSLADFTAQQGVRDTTDVMEKYRKGALGALPDPELINSLLSIKGDVRGDDADAK